MSIYEMPGEGQARSHSASPVKVNGVTSSGPPARRRASVEGEGTRGRSADLALALIVAAELAFVLIALVWGGHTLGQTVAAAGCATAIGLLAYHGRSIMLCVGRIRVTRGESGHSL
ncbi:hypothetical protein ACTWP5_29470 [Streptomyces sp. 4N509B]|uniref:hypothetical protein n=1 Tax=Streptomyces sp. 4N509B TaxID=3457413 RepID=UPI003FD66847